MPKPIPPPPPQPSEEETQKALIWLRNAVLVVVALFLLNAQLYTPNAFFVQYGRESSQEWIVEKIKRADISQVRSHEGGKIIWLIGSSMMRDAFDETYLNQELEEKNSPYRVFKLGMNRGAPGIVFGLMSMIPFQEGDKLLVNVHETHFKKDWLKFSKLPSYRLMTLYTLQDYWNISEWSLADKLEQSSAFPWNFYAYHESYTRGATRWLSAFTKPTWPEKEGPSYHWTYNKAKKIVKFRRGKKNRDYFDRDALDFSATQFNIQGLLHIQQTFPSSIDIHWVYIPASEIYRSEIIHQFHESQFQDWAKEQDNFVYFPQAPDEAYYDIKHANKMGRTFYSDLLLNWIEIPKSGTYPVLTRKRTSDRIEP
jgi:hypothetical protein